MDDKSFDYLKHTAMKLVSSEIDFVVDRIQKGTPKNEETNTTAIHGINSVLSFYADNARDVEVTPIDEVNEIMDGTIIKVSGGFNVFCSNSNYYLFKQSIQKNITANERKRLEKEIGKGITSRGKIKCSQRKWFIPWSSWNAISGKYAKSILWKNIL